MIMHK